MNILFSKHSTQKNFPNFFIAEMGMSGYYKTDTKITNIFQLYLSLPHLPELEIRPQLQYIRSLIKTVTQTSARKKLLVFHSKYLKSFWLKKVTPQRLSVFGLHRKTTNDIENLHKQMNRRLPRKAGFFKFVHALETHIYHADDVQLIQLANGQRVRQPKRKGQRIHEL